MKDGRVGQVGAVGEGPLGSQSTRQLFSFLLLLSACATTAPPAVAPVGTLARARQDYTASLDTCEQVRDSRLSTLGPPIFQPIPGDALFNECLSRAHADYVAELNEAN